MVKGKIILSKDFLGGHVMCTEKTSLEGWIIRLHKEQGNTSWLVRVPMY
jgi:hypothetical protein